MPSPEFIKIVATDYDPARLHELGIAPYVKTPDTGNPFFYARVDKTMPGFPQAGFYANQQLVRHLRKNGYGQTSTPSLFRHERDEIFFTLVVDDFGIKYRHIDDFHRLVTCLAELYHVKAAPLATDYLGMTITQNPQARTITLSMPGYIPALLQRVRPNGIKHAASPILYIPLSMVPQRPRFPHRTRLH